MQVKHNGILSIGQKSPTIIYFGTNQYTTGLEATSCSDTITFERKRNWSLKPKLNDYQRFNSKSSLHDYKKKVPTSIPENPTTRIIQSISIYSISSPLTHFSLS